MKENKGISPLIAASVLIVLVIGIGFIVSTFLTNLTEESKIKVEQKGEKSVTCGGAQLFIDEDSIRFGYPKIDGLISYWSFDEGSGSIVHDYEGDNDGTTYESMIDNFDDGDYTSNPSWTLDCGGITEGDLVSGYKSAYALRLNSTGGDGLACAHTSYDAIIGTMITYICKGSRCRMCVYNGTICINSPQICADDVEDWTICRTNITQTQTGVKIFIYNDGQIGHTSTYDLISEGPVWVDGKYGYALNFDGVDDYVKITDNDDSLDPDILSLSAWIYVNKNLDIQRIFQRKSGTWGFYTDTSGATLTFYIDTTDDGGSWKGSSTSISLGEWHFITGVYNNSKVMIYVDGILKNSIDNSGLVDNGDLNAFIGTHDGNIQFFNGSIDEVRIYNKALTEEEIQNLMNKKIFLDIENIGQTDLSKLKIVAYNETGVYTYNATPSSILRGTKVTIVSDGAPQGTITKIKVYSEDCPGVEAVAEKEDNKWETTG